MGFDPSAQGFEVQVIYADTSFLLAMRVPSDNFQDVALVYYETTQESVWLWSPWHRVEIFNSLRQLVRWRSGSAQPPPGSANRFPPDACSEVTRGSADSPRPGAYLHSVLRWSSVTVTTPLALMVMWRVSCTR